MLVKDLRHWVPLALKQMNQVHKLLLPQLQVADLILHDAHSVVHLIILMDEGIEIISTLRQIHVHTVLRKIRTELFNHAWRRHTR